MKCSENCLFSLMRRRNSSSEMGFLRSPKQLHPSTVELRFDVPTISLDRESWENVVFGKLYVFEQCESNVKFFQKCFLSFYIKSWVGRCKAIFFADAQPVQKIFFCVVQQRLICFPMRFQFWASDVQSSAKKQNHLFRTEFQKERSFKKVILCVTLFDERLLVFVYKIWAQADLLSKL